jgi:hypothetical protein
MSHREEAPRQKLTAPDSSETPEARTPLTDDLIKKYEPSSLLHQFQQVVSLARQLELSLSQCREAQRWIPVSERLPEPDAWVLTTNGKWTGVARHRPLEDDGYMVESERWQSETSDFIEHLGPPVTHWQPLPSVPKE